MVTRRKMETAKTRTDCISRLVQVANQSQNIVINMSLLVEALVSLWDDIEIYIRGGQVNLNDTLGFIAEIRGSVDALFSLSQIQFSITKERESLTNDFNKAVRSITSSSQSLKVVLRQAYERDRLSSLSSAEGNSPSKSPHPLRSHSSSSSITTVIDSNGSCKTTNNVKSKKLSRKPSKVTKCSPIDVSPSFSLSYRPSSNSLLNEFQSSPFKPNDDTSVWDSSLPSSRSYTSPTIFHSDTEDKHNKKITPK